MNKNIEVPLTSRARISVLYSRYLEAKRDLSVVLQATQDALGLEGDWELDIEEMTLVTCADRVCATLLDCGDSCVNANNHHGLHYCYDHKDTRERSYEEALVNGC